MVTRVGPATLDPDVAERLVRAATEATVPERLAGENWDRGIGTALLGADGADYRATCSGVPTSALLGLSVACGPAANSARARQLMATP